MNKQEEHEEYNIHTMSPHSSLHLPLHSSSHKNSIVSLLSDAIACSQSASCSGRDGLLSMSRTKISNKVEKESRDSDDDDSTNTSLLSTTPSSCISFASFSSTKDKLSISDLLLSLPKDKSYLKAGICTNTQEGSLHDSLHSFDLDITLCNNQNEIDDDSDDDECDDSSFSTFNFDDYLSSSNEVEEEDDDDDKWDDEDNELFEELYHQLHKKQDRPKSPRKVRFSDVTIREYLNLPHALTEDKSIPTDTGKNDSMYVSCQTMILTNEANKIFINHVDTTSTAPELTNDTTKMISSLYSINKQLQKKQRQRDMMMHPNKESNNNLQNSNQSKTTANIIKSHPNNDIRMNVDDYEWIRQMKSYARLLEKNFQKHELSKM